MLNRAITTARFFTRFTTISSCWEAATTRNFKQKPTHSTVRNEAHNGLKNRRGTVAMARQADAIDSAASQFFINLADNTSLDFTGSQPDQYGYCVFGEVIAGMDVVDRIAKAEVHSTAAVRQCAGAPGGDRIGPPGEIGPSKRSLPATGRRSIRLLRNRPG